MSRFSARSAAKAATQAASLSMGFGHVGPYAAIK